MTLLFSTHTLNLVFLPKSFRGAPPPPLKGQEGGRTHMPPTDLRLSKNNQEGANWKIIGRQTGQIASGGKVGKNCTGGHCQFCPNCYGPPLLQAIFLYSLFLSFNFYYNVVKHFVIIFK